MEFVKITSRCNTDINAEIRCEHCGATEIVYGTAHDVWYQSVKEFKCLKCGKGGVSGKGQEKNSR